MIDAEKCEYYSIENGRKNGKACIKDPNNPCRCMPWLYGYDCIDCINKEDKVIITL